MWCLSTPPVFTPFRAILKAPTLVGDIYYWFYKITIGALERYLLSSYLAAIATGNIWGLLSVIGGVAGLLNLTTVQQLAGAGGQAAIGIQAI